MNELAQTTADGLSAAAPIVASATLPSTTEPLNAVTPAIAPSALKATSSGDMLWQLVQLLGSLALVIGLIFLVAWLFKRSGGWRPQSQLINVLQRTSIGSKEQLVLVEVHNQQLLLGVASGSVNLLHSFSAEQIAALEQEPQLGAKADGGIATAATKASTPAAGFAQQLAQLMGTRAQQ